MPPMPRAAQPQPSEDLPIYELNHLPLVSEYARRLGLVELLNSHVDSEMNVGPGEFVLMMLLDTLSGRSPLYRLPEFAKNIDIEMLTGSSYAPEEFNDDAAARVLDKIYQYGAMKLFTMCAVRACQVFDLQLEYLHRDMTRVFVHGAYHGSEQEDSPFHIRNGYNSQHRTDVKQFVLDLLCLSRDVPLWASYEDGNASDKNLHHELLTELSKQLAGLRPTANQWIFIADSALITESNLEAMGETLFISRLPASFKEHQRVVEKALEDAQWHEVGHLAASEGSPKRPAARYRMSEQTVELYEQEYRALVVHSSAHDKRRHKRIDKQFAASENKVKKVEKIHRKKEFSCKMDAQNAAKELETQYFPFHRLVVEVEERPKYGRGRPSKKKPRKVKSIDYGLQLHVEEKSEEVERAREQAGCFVLVSNVPKTGEQAHRADDVLKAYKSQQGIENNFGFLKDPFIVNRMFLEKPERLEALGLILLLSLLIWRLMERAMRNYVQEEDTTLEGYERRPSKKPTGKMMQSKFSGVKIVVLNGHKRLAAKLTKVQKKYLDALDVSAEVFSRPIEHNFSKGPGP